VHSATFFKTSFVFHRRKKVIQVWNNIRVSRFNFGELFLYLTILGTLLLTWWEVLREVS